MQDDQTVVDLVFRAKDGDNSAWNDLVDRYAPLVWGICRAHRLGHADADDVGQNVWLLLVEHLAAIREPAALPGWLATTTRRECLRVLRVRQQGIRASTAVEKELTVEPAASPSASPVEDLLLIEERNEALRLAFRQLPSNCQQLLSLLLHDPPIPYAEISRRLGMKIGGLGPRRARCLNKLRRCPPLAELIESATGPERGEGRERPMVER